MHPSEIELAQYSGGDLSLWKRWAVTRHVRTCVRCREALDDFAAAGDELRALSDELPAGVNWTRLSAEMKANIRLGLAAGECVGPAPVFPAPDRTGWRAAVVLASASLIVIVGWWLNTPVPKAQPAASAQVQGVLLEAIDGGIELKQDDRAMTLRHPHNENVTLTVNTQGSVRARYIDSDTGQVTINHVYAQ